MVSTDRGLEHISSHSLADFVSVNAWRIRTDSSYFGDFDAPSLGYNIEKLARGIKKILRLDMIRKVAFVGAGDPGSGCWPIRASRRMD